MRIIHVTYRYDTTSAGIKKAVKSLSAAQNRLPDLDVWIYSAKEKILTDPMGNKKRIAWSALVQLEPSLVVFHSIYQPIFYPLSLRLKGAGIPYAVKPHGSLNCRAQKKSPLKKNLAHWLWIDRWLNGAKGLIFLCGEEAADSRFDPSSSAIVPNSFPLDFLPTHSSGRMDDLVRLMVLSRIVPHHKGLDRFFESLSKLPENTKKQIAVDIYGMGNPRNLQWLQDAIASLPDLAISFHGPVYGEDKREAYGKGGIFCLFSRSEGLPLTLYEAAACGMPLLVTEGSNRVDWVRQEACGWVLLDGQQAEWGSLLAEVIFDYQANHERYEVHAQNAANRLPTWQEIAEESVEIYRKWGNAT